MTEDDGYADTLLKADPEADEATRPYPETEDPTEGIADTVLRPFDSAAADTTPFDESAEDLVKSAPTPTAGASGTELQVTGEHRGRYAGEEEVGRGGLGRVTSVYDQHLARKVARKELLTEAQAAMASGSGSTSQAVARFLREARVTAQLEHPNIVPVYELGQGADGKLYYTMKLVRGRTLKRAIAQADDLQDRLHLLPHFVDLCQAIGYAHNRGVIHRDIKPDNVMIGEFGETLVLDWGVAKLKGSKDLRGEDLARAVARLRDEEGAKTLPGSAFGTPVYMAPEQADGRIEDVDERSDVWALGVVLYQLLSGRIPYPETHVLAVLVRASKAELIPLDEVADDAPPELRAVVARALAPAPADRYDSAKALADDVEAFMTGQRVGAYRYSTREVLARFVAEHRPAVTVSAIAALVLMIVLAGAYLGLREERDRALDAERVSREHFADVLVERARAHARTHDWVGVELLATEALQQHEEPEARGLLLEAQAGLRPELVWSERTYAGCAALARVKDSLLCGTSFGVARFGLEDGAQIGRIETPGGWVRALASPEGDGSVLAGGDGAALLRLDPVDNGSRPLAKLATSVLAVASIDGAPRVVTERGAIIALRGEAGTPEVRFEGDTAVARAAAGPGALAFADVDGFVVRDDGQDVRRFDPGHGGPLTALAISGEGRRIASAGEDRGVRIFDRFGHFTQHLRDRQLGVVTALRFWGRALLAGTEDGEIAVLDLDNAQVVARFVAHEGPVDRLEVVPGGLVSAGRDRVVRHYRGALPTPKGALDARVLGEARDVALSAGGGEVALVGPWGFRLLTAAGPERVSETRFEAVAQSADGAWLAAGGAGGGVSWRPRGDAVWTDVEPVAAPIVGLAFADGADALYAVARSKELVRIERASRKATVRTLDLSAEPTGLAASGERVVVTADGRVHLFDASGAAQGSLPKTEARATAVALDGEADLLVVGDDQGTVAIWSADGRRLRARLSVGASGVEAVALEGDEGLYVLDELGRLQHLSLAELELDPRRLQRARSKLRGARLDGLRPVPN